MLVKSPDLGLYSFDQTGGIRWVSGFNWGGDGFLGAMDLGINFLGSNIRPEQYVNVELRFAGQGSQPGDPRWSKGYAYKDSIFVGVGDIPMEAWDVENNRRLNICFFVNSNATAPWEWTMGWDKISQTYTLPKGGSEFIFIMNSDYDNGAGAYSNMTGNKYNSDNLYAWWPTGKAFTRFLQSEFELKLLVNHVIVNGEKWTFKLEGVTTSEPLLKTDLKLINAFPNPYFEGFGIRAR